MNEFNTNRLQTIYNCIHKFCDNVHCYVNAVNKYITFIISLTVINICVLNVNLK